MTKGIQHFELIEGNLRAVKDTSDFGGPNMWRLYIKTTKGYWEDVDWMNHYKISQFFTSKLPCYEEEEKKLVNYKLKVI